MSFECEFCKKFYASKQSLKNHQKTAKSCLNIQNELSKTDQSIIVSTISYDCKYCEKTFSSKKRLITHQNTCYDMFKSITNDKDKHIEMLQQIINELEEEIVKLKENNRLIAVETEVRILREQNERTTSTVEEIAKQPRINASTTTNNNQKVLINTPMDMSYQTLNEAIQSSFSGEYLVQGQKGVARFAYDNILKDEEGKLKYICTDAARQIFQYKNEDGSMQKDVRATKLTKALLGSELKSTSHKIACESMRKGGDQEFMKYTDHYQEIREMETDNSDFSKELCTLVV